MQNLKTQSLVLFLSTLCLLTGAHAQFTPSDDSNTDSLASKTTNGNKVTLEVVNETGEGATAIDTAFIRFDLTAVPATYTGTSVAKATLKLFVHSVTKAGSFNVNLVNGTWAEATIDYSNQPAIGTTIASNIPLAISNKLDYVEIDITPAVVDWLNGTQANDGIALVPNDPLSATFDSKENTTTSHPAELDIVFNSGGTLTGVTTASGSGLTGGGTSGTLNLSLTPCSNADPILVWNNGGWGCSTVSGGGGGITGSGTPGALPVFNGITSLTSSYVFQNGSNIGIGTTTPQATLDVNGVVNAAISFNIGETPFAFGSSSNQNAFLGFAGNSNISNVGEANTAVGYNSLAANTTGNANTATGNGALLNNTMGGNNMANGASALVSNTTGNANSASGTQSLFYNTMGSANSASGFKALFNNTTGNNNTALGFTAGNPTNSANTTGSNNTFVGSTANSGTQTNLNNATAIGANAQVTVINALVLGSIFGTNGCDTPCGSVSVGIGTTAPGATLDVEAPSGNPAPTVNFGSASNPATFTVNGNATIAGAGNALFFPDGSKQTTAYTGGGGGITSVTGTNGVNATTSGGAVTVGLASNSCAYGSALSALPFTCFPFATLGLNTFTASQSVMGNITATGVVTGSAFQIGSNLFAFGSYANQNAFLGFAGNTATTGSMNTAVGESSLFNNTTGGSNTAIGYALFANSTGGSNAGVGVNTLNNNTTGSFNSAFGVFAGQVLDGTAGTGLNDTAVGSGAGFGTGTLSNATALGSNSEVNENNALVLGSVNGLNGATSNVNVGIGTATPQFMLDVQGTGNFTGALTAGGGAIFPASPNPGTSGSPSNPLDLTASASNGSTASNQTFRWQAANADGTSPSANLNLLFGSAGATPVATGFSVAPNGTLTAPAIVSTKDLTETIGGNLIEKAAINISQQAGADLSLQSSGNSVDISPAGVTLTGAIVQVQGPTIVTGMTTVQGSLTVTGAVTCGSGCGGGGGSGTVTSVGSGPGLTGGPITSSGTLSIATAGVTNAMLANPSVTISPGTDLMGGGTVALGGTTTLSVNTASLPQLTGGNSFTGNQTVNGNITATTVSADTGFLLSSGGNLPATVLSSNNVAGTNNDVFLGYSAGTFTGGAFGPNNIGLGNNTLNALSGGADNTASGYDALHNTSSGGSNTGSGYSALLGNSSGSNNTAVGSFAAEYNTTGSNNTALGYKAGPDSSTPTLNNATAIGAFADVQQPNSLVLGSIANVNGCSPTGTPACQSASVGIGTTSPQGTLDVEAPTVGTPSVNFFVNSANQGTFTVNGTTITGNLTVNGTCTGCGSGSGGITNVIAGTDLTGGGTSPTVTLNLNVSATDARYSQLGANNIFTGSQTINASSSGLTINASSFAVSAATSSTSNPGVFGNNTATSGANADGVFGQTSSSSGSGVAGTNNSASGAASGVFGQSLSPTGTGVYGLGNSAGVTGSTVTSAGSGVVGTNSATSGSAYGVYGQSLSTTGTGVYGTGSGSGVTGSTSTSTGSGVVASNSATSGNAYGVYAQSLSSSGTGVYGTGSAAGVTGSSSSSTGSGVVGSNTAASGNAYGVYGQSSSTTGAGVFGDAAASSGTTYGVAGLAASSSGAGVYGVGSSSTGVGVYGVGLSSSATGSVILSGTPSAWGVWGDTSQSILQNGANAREAAVLGTADNAYAGAFYNNSSAPTLFLQNAGGGGETGDAKSDALLLTAYGGNTRKGCTIDTSGTLGCEGTVTAVVATNSGASKVALYSVQSPENWFEDFGSSQLVNGVAAVSLESVYAQTVNTDMEYHVFLTPRGECEGLYVGTTTASGFEVRELHHGTSNIKFDYRIVARRKGYEAIRLADRTEQFDRIQRTLPASEPGQGEKPRPLITPHAPVMRPAPVAPELIPRVPQQVQPPGVPSVKAQAALGGGGR